MPKETKSLPTAVQLRKQYPEMPRNCLRCKLFLQAKNPKIPTRVIHEGNTDKKVLFVAMNPGRQEDEQNEILVGKSGQLLQEYIDEYFSDYICYGTNTIKCFCGADDISAKEIRECSSFLKEDIEEINPDVIIWLGQVAKEGKRIYEEAEQKQSTQEKEEAA